MAHNRVGSFPQGRGLSEHVLPTGPASSPLLTSPLCKQQGGALTPGTCRSSEPGYDGL
jgi:hypothetical protein